MDLDLALRAALVALVLAGCAPAQPAGSLRIGAFFPAAEGQRRLLVIPEKTTSIVVRVTGDKIPAGSVLQTTLTPEKATATFDAVPSGWKQVTARCYDAADGLLASGETTVLIEPMRTARATLRLDPVSDEGGFSLILQ